MRIPSKVLRHGAMVALVALCAACTLGCDKNKKTDSSPAASDAIDGHARLSADVVPTAYDVTWRLDPATDTFSGEVAIDVDVKRETELIELHAEDLTLRGVDILSGGEEVSSASVLKGSHGGIGLQLEQPIAAGAYTITMSFDGPLDEVPTGLYRVQEQGEWYAFTQFEPLEARKAFPCFDEPRFKTPFTVTIHAPEGLFAASNAPEIKAEPSADEEGWTAHTYQETRPLPTYLVALTVGDLDVVEAPEGAIPGVPLRLLAPKGKGDLGRFALERTPPILADLTEYFGQPYPFAKLDIVAVPDFAAGAMENVGLVTFREGLLLMDEETATPRTKYYMQSVMAHELAHMWFGNLVTPDWWDELWLNESFATWMASRVLERLDPSLQADLRQVRSVDGIMDSDSLTQTRAIRQPIKTGGDIRNAFDSITYGKGAAVLRMVEAWLGEEKMREGVRLFMEQNAYGTVTTKELMAALEEVSGEPVYAVMKTFIDQPGAPLLRVEPSCAQAQATLDVTQTRYLPKGSNASQTGRWRVPMCVKFARDGAVSTECYELTEASQTIELPGQGCPEWVHPNANEAGYYHWSLPAEQMLAMAKTHREALNRREQLALLGHLDALVDAQAIAPKAYFEAALGLLDQTNEQIVDEAVSVLAGMHRVAGREGMEDVYAAMLRDELRPHLDRLGLDTEPGESPNRASLRTKILMLLGGPGESAYVMSNAKGLVPPYLEEPNAFPAYRAQWAIALAASEGDPKLWDGLVDVIGRATKPSARSSAVRGVGHFEDPELYTRSLDLFLTDTLRSNEMWSVLGPSFSDEELFTTVTWPWFTAHYEDIVDKIGQKSAPRLPYVGTGFCTEEGHQKVQAFFEGLDDPQTGMERNLSMALERIDRSVTDTAYITPAVVEILINRKDAMKAVQAK